MDRHHRHCYLHILGRSWYRVHVLRPQQEFELPGRSFVDATIIPDFREGRTSHHYRDKQEGEGMKATVVIIVLTVILIFSTAAAAWDGVYDIDLRHHAESQHYFSTKGTPFKLVIIDSSWSITFFSKPLFLGNLFSFLNDGRQFFLNGQKLASIHTEKTGMFFNGDTITLEKVSSFTLNYP